MLKKDISCGMNSGGGGGTTCTRICDTCRSAPGTIYCQADSAYLCTGCDARIHAANRVASRHERAWVCEACERAPAAFICKADSAVLCAMCDSDIHSANPLAQRHHRVPIMPITGTIDGKDAENQFLTREVVETIHEDDAEEAASWLLFNPVKNNGHGNSNTVLFGGEVVDQYLDLDDYNSDQQNRFGEHYDNQFGDQKCGSDSVVPVQSGESKNLLQRQSFQLGMEYEAPNVGYAYPASFSHSVSVSSLDVAVVPDTSRTDGGSISHPRPQKGTIDLFSSLPPQLTPMDREARVLKYREKKKTRKFEKTIRYASRKAYAETRPRIKGRFAKRADMEAEAGYVFSKTLMAESGYVVPSY